MLTSNNAYLTSFVFAEKLDSYHRLALDQKLALHGVVPNHLPIAPEVFNTVWELAIRIMRFPKKVREKGVMGATA